MKCTKILILCLVLLLTAAMIGCGSSGVDGPVSEPKMDHLLVQASVSGGIGYSYLMGMATIAEKVLPGVTVTLEATDGYVDNAVRMSKGIGEIGVMGAEDAYKIAMKQPPYQDAPKRVLAVFAIHTLDWVVIVPNDSNIETIRDLEGKIVNLQPKGSIAQSMSEAILDALGIDHNPQYLPHAEAADAMRTGQIDAHLVGGSSVPFRELSERFQLRLISLSKNEIDAIRSRLPYLAPVTHDGSIHYKGTGKIDTVTLWAPAVAREDVPDEIIYTLLKGIFDNLDKMIEAHPGAANMKPEQILEMGIPVHPGAVKYYEEIGITIPAALRP